jgi:hypothetical protein
MWMSNYDDEAKFDECVKTLTRGATPSRNERSTSTRDLCR